MVRAVINGIMFLGAREHHPHPGASSALVPWRLPLTTCLLKWAHPCPQLGVTVMQLFGTENGLALGLALIRNGSAGLKQTLPTP